MAHGHGRRRGWSALVLWLAVLGVTIPTRAASVAGTLQVSFFYAPPGAVHPTYHTAIWLEDEQGRMVTTLFVSQDLSSGEYRMGEACPDWVKQAHWEKADPALVDAVTGPTPQVGSGSLRFDLGATKLPSGHYDFRFQVHITGGQNVLFHGPLVIGDAPQVLTLDTLYSPARPAGATDVVRDVRVRYTPVGIR